MRSGSVWCVHAGSVCMLLVTVCPRLSKLRLSGPSIIRTSNSELFRGALNGVVIKIHFTAWPKGLG